MSLNLISSLSFLKSKLGAVPRPEVKTAKLDLYSGITESDLDSSSSESEEEEGNSSQCASPSTGYSTPGAKTGPTADILQKCLDILNSDISDSETLPQPDVVKEAPVHKPETQYSDEKKTVGTLHQGLLKIASPLPERTPRPHPDHSTQTLHNKSSRGKDSFQPLSVNVSSSRGGVTSPPPPRGRAYSPPPELGRVSVNSTDSDDDPGPPELELMVSLVKTSSPPPTLTNSKPKVTNQSSVSAAQPPVQVSFGTATSFSQAIN